MNTAIYSIAFLMMLINSICKTNKGFLIFSLVYFVLMFCTTIPVHLEILECVEINYKWAIYLSLAASGTSLIVMIVSFIFILKNYNQLTQRTSDFRASEN